MKQFDFRIAFENSRINIYTLDLDIISQNKLFRKEYVYNIFQNLTVFNSKISNISRQYLLIAVRINKYF